MIWCIIIIIIGIVAMIDSVSHVFGITIIQGWIVQKIENKTVRTVLRAAEFLIGLGLVIYVIIICFIRA